jgi:probable HAF family extracellular repeat protein
MPRWFACCAVQTICKQILRDFGITFAFLFTFSYPCSAQSLSYTITDLGTLGGSISVANGINQQGEVVGYSYLEGDARYHAFLYDGAMHDLGSLCATCDSWGTAINDSSVTAGASFTPAGQFQAVVFDGAIQCLGDLGGGESVARGINNAGQVAGAAYDSGHLGWKPFLYSDGTMQLLSNDFGDAYGINNSGVVVGQTDTNGMEPFLFDGSFQNLGAVIGQGIAFAVNDNNDVVGTGFLYSGGFVTRLPLYFALRINNLGQIAGSGGGQAMLLVPDGSQVNLNSVVTNGSDWLLEFATGINDAGQIVGYGLHNGVRRAFRLDAVPDPTSFDLR